MEAEESIGEDVVDGCPGTVPVIGKFGVGSITGYGEFFPL